MMQCDITESYNWCEEKKNQPDRISDEDGMKATRKQLSTSHVPQGRMKEVHIFR